MIAYDVTRMVAGGVKTTHHESRLVTEGPWLIVGGPDVFELIAPAHAVVDVVVCEGRCRDGRE